MLVKLTFEFTLVILLYHDANLTALKRGAKLMVFVKHSLGDLVSGHVAPPQISTSAVLRRVRSRGEARRGLAQ